MAVHRCLRLVAHRIPARQNLPDLIRFDPEYRNQLAAIFAGAARREFDLLLV
jgi:hypothetical protein